MKLGKTWLLVVVIYKSFYSKWIKLVYITENTTSLIENNSLDRNKGKKNRNSVLYSNGRIALNSLHSCGGISWMWACGFFGCSHTLWLSWDWWLQEHMVPIMWRQTKTMSWPWWWVLVWGRWRRHASGFHTDLLKFERKGKSGSYSLCEIL